MLIYNRPKGNLFRRGRHVVYESIEEAEKFGKQVKNKYPLAAGDWTAYDDGKVAEILRLTENPKRVLYYTSLNQFVYFKESKAFLGKRHGVYTSKFSMFRDTLDLNEITDAHRRFATDWLFRGLTLAQAVKKNYEGYFPQALYFYDSGNTIRTRNEFQDYETFALLVLSGHWFDKLLKQSRPHRDRYMNLVKSLKDAGITEASWATELKKHMESDNPKSAIPALKMVLDVFAAEEARNKGKEIPANGSQELRGMITEAEEVPQPLLERHEAGISKLNFPIVDAVQPEAVLRTDEEIKAFLVEEGVVNPKETEDVPS